MTQEALNRTIGKALAERRRAAEKRQADVARECGISRSSLANIEKGRQSLSLFLLYQIAEALDVADPRSLLPKGVPAERHPPTSSPPVHIRAGSESLSEAQLAQVADVVSKTVR